MKSTDLLNPGDFHQVTHQIRELVAYAISQLEIAEADGSLPSGKFAAFLADAAQKTPGFIGGETGLASHQSLLEDGQTIKVSGHDVIVSVADSLITSAKLKADNVRILQHGDQCWNKVGFRTISAKLDFDSSSINAVSVMPNAAIVVDGEEHPMHDQGGHAGRITSKVTANNVTDMVFTTEGAHIIRHGDKVQCLNRDGATGTFEILPDKSVGYRLTSGKYWVAGVDDAVWVGSARLGSAAGARPDGAIGMHMASSVAYMNTDVTKMITNPMQDGGHVYAKPVRNSQGYCTSLVMSSDCYGLRNEVLFYVNGKDLYQPLISGNRINELSGVI